MLKTKDKAKEMEYKLVFLGEEAACCLPPCPAKCCSGVRSCWAGQAAQQAWLCTQGTAVPVGPCCKTHHQLVSAAPAQPSKHQHPVISTGAGPAFPFPRCSLIKILFFNIQHTKLSVVVRSGSAPKLSAEKLPATDTRDGRGENSGLHLEIFHLLHTHVTLGRERDWIHISKLRCSFPCEGPDGVEHCCLSFLVTKVNCAF